jgi:hypothetical protein
MVICGATARLAPRARSKHLPSADRVEAEVVVVVAAAVAVAVAAAVAAVMGVMV